MTRESSACPGGRGTMRKSTTSSISSGSTSRSGTTTAANTLQDNPETSLSRRARDLEKILDARETLLKRTRKLLMAQLQKLQVEEATLEERLASVRRARFASQAQDL